MKKWSVAGLILGTAVLVMMLTGCGKNSYAVTREAGGTLISFEKSGLAKICEKTLLALYDDKSYFEEENFDAVLQEVENRGEQILPSCRLKNTEDCESLEGYNVYTLTDESYENVILYIHGGAWIFEITKSHVQFCDDLADRLNARVYIPLYPLAPESDGEESYTFLEKLYKEILKEGKTVYIMGDSAGGELALGLLHTIKAENLEMPARLVLLSPCSDMTFSNETIAEIEKTDPELAVYGCRQCAELWAGEENLQDPLYSALYADVTGYPDTIIFQGTNDILSPDNLLLYEKLLDAGVEATMVLGEGLWHDFSLYPIPERETSLTLIEDFCSD